jgi:hypothetical protein
LAGQAYHLYEAQVRLQGRRRTSESGTDSIRALHGQAEPGMLLPMRLPPLPPGKVPAP